MTSATTLRIMEVVQSLEKGGRTVRFHDTVNALCQSGHQVIAVCFGPFDKPTNAEHDIALPQISGKKFGLIWQLAKLIKKHNINLVHAHCESSQLYAGLAAKLCRIPAVGTFHRSRLECYNPSLSNRLIRFALSHFVAVSEDRMRLLTGNMGLRDSHCSVVYGGTSLLSVPARTKQQARAELGLNTDSKILLSIGHLGAIKGHQDTLQALALLNDADVQLFIAGTGTEAEKRLLVDLTQTLQLQHQVTFLGQITDPALWLDACDIFVQPSHEEAFGLVFIEAGARRRPVIATHVGGIKEIILHSVTGLLVTPASARQLAENMQKLLDDSDSRQSMGDAGFNRVHQTFSVEAMTTRYLKIFQKLMPKEGSYYDAS